MESRLFIIFGILSFAFITNSHTGFRAKFKNLECAVNSSWVADNYTCIIKARSRNKHTLEMYMYALKPLRILQRTFTLYKRYNGWKPWVFKTVTISLCDLLARRTFHPVYNMFRKMYAKYTNLNHTCPFEGPIIARDLNIDDLQVGLTVIPTGYYRLDVYVYEEDKIFVGFLKFYVDIVELD